VGGEVRDEDEISLCVLMLERRLTCLSALTHQHKQETGGLLALMNHCVLSPAVTYCKSVHDKIVARRMSG
jgi:hypothetical protein